MHDKNKLGNLQGNVADTDVLDEITPRDILRDLYRVRLVRYNELAVLEQERLDADARLERIIPRIVTLCRVMQEAFETFDDVRPRDESLGAHPLEETNVLVSYRNDHDGTPNIRVIDDGETIDVMAEASRACETDRVRIDTSQALVSFVTDETRVCGVSADFAGERFAYQSGFSVSVHDNEKFADAIPTGDACRVDSDRNLAIRALLDAYDEFERNAYERICDACDEVLNGVANTC